MIYFAFIYPDFVGRSKLIRIDRDMGSRVWNLNKVSIEKVVILTNYKLFTTLDLGKTRI